jgi:hypothetical protein
MLRPSVPRQPVATGDRTGRLTQRSAAAVAVLFGLATLVAGGRVLMGFSDMGYVVYRPLLVYNTAMGAAYVAAGAAIWYGLRWGRHAALAIALLNLLVLAGVALLYAAGGPTAIESVRAMGLRTFVWIVLFLVLLWKSRR